MVGSRGLGCWSRDGEPFNKLVAKSLEVSFHWLFIFKKKTLATYYLLWHFTHIICHAHSLYAGRGSAPKDLCSLLPPKHGL